MWEHVAAALETRGHGTVVATQPLPAHSTFSDVPILRQSISSIVDGLSGPPPVLCGTSLGALVAMELAPAIHPATRGSSSPEQSTSVPNSRRNGFRTHRLPNPVALRHARPDQPGHQVAQRRRHVPDVHFVEIPLCGISPMIEHPTSLPPGAGLAGNRACAVGTQSPVTRTRSTQLKEPTIEHASHLRRRRRLVDQSQCRPEWIETDKALRDYGLDSFFAVNLCTPALGG